MKNSFSFFLSLSVLFFASSSFAKTPKLNSRDLIQHRQYAQSLDEAALRKLEYIVRNKVGPKATRATYVVRLASLYAKKAKVLQLEYASTSDESVKKKSQALFEKAATKLEWVMKNASKAVRLDRALFDLAFYQLELGRTAQARRYFERIVQEYPHSKVIPDTALILGDLYFDSKSLSKAGKMYLLSEKGATSARAKNYARYRRAWVEFNQANIDSAISLMLSCAFGSGGSSAEKSEFREEALGDLVTFYSRQGSLKEGYDQLSRRIAQEKGSLQKSTQVNDSGEESSEAILLRRFMDRAFEDGATPTAIDFARIYISKHLPGAKLSHVYNTMLKSLIALQQDFHAEVQEWGSHFQPESDFVLIFKPDSEIVKKAKAQYKEFLQIQATRFHAQAKKVKTNEKLWKKTEVLYEAFLNTFNEPDYRFRFAHLLLERKQKDRALTHYEKAYPALEGKQKKEAHLQALWLRQDGVFARTAKESETVELDESDKKFIEIAQSFTQAYPQAEETPGIKMTIATLYYQRGDLAQAEKSAQNFIQAHADHKLAKRAWRFLMDIYTKNKDFKKIQAAIPQAFQNQKVLGDSVLSAELKQLSVQADFNAAETILKNKDFSGALSAFEKLARSLKDQELVRKSRWNAAIAAKELNQYGTTQKHLEWVIKNGTPERKKEAEVQSLELALKVGDLDRASKISIRWGLACASKACDDKVYNAAALSLMSGDRKMAERLFKKHLKLKAPHNPQWYVMAQSLGKDRWIVSQFKARQVIPADILIDLAERTPRMREQVAERLGRAHPYRKRVEALALWKKTQKISKKVLSTSLRVSERRQVKNMKKMLDLIQKVKEQTRQIVSYQDPASTLLALANVDDVLRHVSSSMRTAPVPRRLSKEQVAIYREQINAKAGSIDLEAEEFLGLAQNLVLKLKLVGKQASGFFPVMADAPDVDFSRVSLERRRTIFEELMQGKNVETHQITLIRDAWARNNEARAAYLISHWKKPEAMVVQNRWLSLYRKGKFFAASGVAELSAGVLAQEPGIAKALTSIDERVSQAKESILKPQAQPQGESQSQES